MRVKVSNKQLIELWREGSLTVGESTFTVIEEGDWDGAGEKYQKLNVVFTDGERRYRSCISRLGSYFSDWEYVDFGDADIDEVEKITRTVTVTQWEPILERGYHVYDTHYPDEGAYFTTIEPDHLVTILGPAVRTRSGWHAVEQTKEAV